MMLILLACLGCALSRPLLTAVSSSAPPSSSGIVPLHRTPQKASKDGSQSVHPAFVPIRVHSETAAAARTQQQFLTHRDLHIAPHIAAAETPVYSKTREDWKGSAAPLRSPTAAAASSRSSAEKIPLDPSSSPAGSKQWHFNTFSFLQESPLPNTVIVVVVGAAFLLLLIIVAIITHYVSAMRSQPRRGGIGYNRQQQYTGQTPQCEQPPVPSFNPDVFSAAVASRQFSPLNSFNSLYNLPPGFIERKTPREIEYERRVMNTRLARGHSRHVESPPTPREGKERHSS